METTIYLIRHAQSHPSSQQHYSQWPLSAVGKQQAVELAPLLEGLGIDRLYSSPYRRCLETIRPFTEQARLLHAVEHDLGERVISKVLLSRFEEVWKRSWQDFDFALPGCESSAAAQSRFCGAIRKIVEENRGSTLGISSHGNVIALFLNHLDRSYSAHHAARLRNPEVIKVIADEARFWWQEDFLLPGLDTIATPHDQTPIDFR